MNVQEISSKPVQNILQFSVPSIIAMVLTSVITVTDGFFIGNYISADGLAAVNLGLPIVYLFLATGLMVSVGGSAIAGVAMGTGDIKRGRNVFNQTMTVTFLASIIVGALSFVFFDPMLRLLRVEGSVLVFAKEYFFIMLFEYPLMILNTSFGMFIRADGQPDTYMKINILNVALNILLDYVFVKLDFGIRGIAFASLLSALVASVLNVLYFASSSNQYKFGKFTFAAEDLRNMILNGSSEFIGEMSGCISMFCFNFVIMKYFGVDGVTAFTVVGYTVYVFSMIAIGFGQGICPLVSFVFGAKEYALAVKIRKITNVLLAGTGLVFALVLFFGAEVYAGMFVKEDNVRNMICYGIRIFCGTFVISGYNVVGSMYFTSCTKAFESALISSLRGLVLLLAATFTFPALWGLTGLWLISPAVEALSACVTAYFCIREKVSAKVPEVK